MNTTTSNTPGFIAYTMGSLYGRQRAVDSDLMEDAYIRGKKDGENNIKIELIKRGDALFKLAFKNSEDITTKLIEVANQNQIKIYEFHLKIENWDCVKSLIIVDIEDFVSDKIENLYKAANEIAENVNSDTFHWDYSITYASDNLNLDRIVSDGFTLHYEHISRPRTA